MRAAVHRLAAGNHACACVLTHSFCSPLPRFAACSVITAQPDVGRLELTRAVSFVVLATDGLWDVLSDQDAVDVGAATLAARRRSGAGGAGGTSSAGGERLARAMASALVTTALQVCSCVCVCAA